MRFALAASPSRSKSHEANVRPVRQAHGSPNHLRVLQRLRARLQKLHRDRDTQRATDRVERSLCSMPLARLHFATLSLHIGSV